MRALLNDEATSRDRFADVVTQPVHRAVGVPRDIREQLQRMPAHCEPEQLRLGLQAFQSGRLVERQPRQLLQTRWRDQPALARRIGCPIGFDELLRPPELARPRFAELIERPHADHRLQFFARGTNAPEEVRQRTERTLRVRGEQAVNGALRQPLHSGHWNADGR